MRSSKIETQGASSVLLQYDEQDLQAIEESTSMIRSLFNDIAELRDYNQSLTDQLCHLQSESVLKDSSIKALAFEKRMILEENAALNASLRDSETEMAVDRIIDKAYIIIVERELSNSMRFKSSSSSIFGESFDKMSQDKLENFKKQVMNSTKKKQKGSLNSFSGQKFIVNNQNKLDKEVSDPHQVLQRSIIEDQKLTLQEHTNVFSNISKELIAKGAQQLLSSTAGLKTNQNSVVLEESLKTFHKEGTLSQRSSFITSKDFQNITKADTSKQRISQNLKTDVLKHADKNPSTNISSNANSLVKIPESFQNQGFNSKQSYCSIGKKLSKDYADSEKHLKEDLSKIRLGESMPQDLGMRSKELTLREINFKSDPKIFDMKVTTALRIKGHVELVNCQIIKSLRCGFHNLFYNNFNEQKDIFTLFSNSIASEENTFFVSFGGSHSGKTFTLQGLRNSPGLLPNTITALKFDKAINLQIFDVNENETEDLVRLNIDRLSEFAIFQSESGLYEVKVSSSNMLHKVFKVVLSNRMNKTDRDRWNLVIRLIESKTKSLTFIDTCSLTKQNTKNLEFLKLILNKKQDSILKGKHLMTKLLFGNIMYDDKKSKNVFNLIGHLLSTEDKEEMNNIFSLLENQI
jgi:hypothetical protein